MYRQEMTGFQNQTPLRSSPSFKSTHLQRGGLLGNRDAQRPAGINLDPAPRTSRVAQPSRLEILKRERFHFSTKTERVARSLAALNQPSSIELTADEWQTIAENPDIEDQF